MKKFSYLLAAVLIFGAASAFTTAKPMQFTQAYGDDKGNPIAVNTDDIGVTFVCDPGGNYCLYEDEALTIPLQGQSTDYQFRLINP